MRGAVVLNWVSKRKVEARKPAVSSKHREYKRKREKEKKITLKWNKVHLPFFSRRPSLPSSQSTFSVLCVCPHFMSTLTHKKKHREINYNFFNTELSAKREWKGTHKIYREMCSGSQRQMARDGWLVREKKCGPAESGKEKMETDLNLQMFCFGE